ncbi:serine hydrolase domain-containing protein [Actinoallomurus rhizosphaericola]|uniref:serine hydrolase domain-containing protein n=1 Tax=Actinoallomurus rhizosphaericola TaxID=2952536 RepID=UPI0020912197|nr:serine hydrolase domain-containing protein [Actinoallomurus rhizosphaericola]MCO5993857.1 beta-lactamase family protein [Actinoallomurus rhizosphaericola]
MTKIKEDEMPRYTRMVGATVAAAAVMTMSACGSAIAVQTTGSTTAAARARAAAPAAAPYADVREILQRLTAVDGAPGALAEVSDAHGRTVMTSGAADTGTRAPMAGGSRFRIGSMTKMFVATVVLQLVGEHRVALDAPVERYLPGVIRGNGNDGRDITVRQLLQHTSGLPDYLSYLTPQQILNDPLAHHDPRDLVGIALAHPSLFAPGTGWKYSNTNYLLAGMLIENVTGHPYGQEIDRRVSRRLGLRDTSVPGDEPGISGTHPRGYAKPGSSGLVDVTAFNPSVAGASGAMISSGADLDRFLGALVNGRLLRPAELRAMMTTRPTGDSSGRAYGLGLQSRPLPCGGLYWGHDGDIFGFETMGGVTPSGRAVTVMANLDPGGSDAQDADMRTAVTTALCESGSSESR